MGLPEGAGRVEDDRITVVGDTLFPAGLYANGTRTRSVDPRLLGVVVDLTGEEPQIELFSRPLLGEDAALLSAPRAQLEIKRLLDIVISGLALLTFSLVLVVTAIAVKLTSPGPIFFKQKRVGKGEREFDIFKFRTMRVGAEEERGNLIHLNEVSGPVFKIRDDPRMTPIGRFLRRTSIDELPQLWNVLRGDMCLVGPRPPIPDEVAEYGEWERQRLLASPGITCIWQVSGRSELDFETWVKLDIEYIRNWSLGLDLKLLAQTIPAVISGRGAY